MFALNMVKGSERFHSRRVVSHVRLTPLRHPPPAHAKPYILRTKDSPQPRSSLHGPQSTTMPDPVLRLPCSWQPQTDEASKPLESASPCCTNPVQVSRARRLDRDASKRVLKRPCAAGIKQACKHGCCMAAACCMRPLPTWLYHCRSRRACLRCGYSTSRLSPRVEDCSAQTGLQKGRRCGEPCYLTETVESSVATCCWLSVVTSLALAECFECLARCEIKICEDRSAHDADAEIARDPR